MKPIDGDKLQEVFIEECAGDCACCIYGIFDKADFKGCKLIEDAPTIKKYAGLLKELKELRLKNEVILRRLKHLLESDYISQFDQVDPNTKEYVRDIKEADWKVAYLCDQEKSCNVNCSKDHHCKRTCDISHAKNFRPVSNGIYPITYEEVDEHVIANFSFDREQLEKIVDERVIEPIKNGELVIKEKRPKGEWYFGEDKQGQDGWFCSECGFFVPYYEGDINFIREYKVCPRCLAEMVTYTGKDREKEADNEC